MRRISARRRWVRHNRPAGRLRWRDRRGRAIYWPHGRPAPFSYDRYRIVRKLGSGAFATVYLADDEVMGRPVAVKIVTRSADDEGRVVREAQAAAKLSHHHIVTVYEITRGARPDAAHHRVHPGEDPARALSGPRA